MVLSAGVWVWDPINCENARISGHVYCLCNYFRIYGHYCVTLFHFLLGCVAYTECDRCYRCSVVCVCVCLLDTSVSPAKTAEPVEMLFGLWTRVGRKNHVFCGGPDPPRGRGSFTGGCPAPL